MGTYCIHLNKRSECPNPVCNGRTENEQIVHEMLEHAAPAHPGPWRVEESYAYHDHVLTVVDADGRTVLVERVTKTSGNAAALIDAARAVLARIVAAVNAYEGRK